MRDGKSVSGSDSSPAVILKTMMTVGGGAQGAGAVRMAWCSDPHQRQEGAGGLSRVPSSVELRCPLHGPALPWPQPYQKAGLSGPSLTKHNQS